MVPRPIALSALMRRATIALVLALAVAGRAGDSLAARAIAFPALDRLVCQLRPADVERLWIRPGELQLGEPKVLARIAVGPIIRHADADVVAVGRVAPVVAGEGPRDDQPALGRRVAVAKDAQVQGGGRGRGCCSWHAPRERAAISGQLSKQGIGCAEADRRGLLAGSPKGSIARGNCPPERPADESRSSPWSPDPAAQRALQSASRNDSLRREVSRDNEHCN